MHELLHTQDTTPKIHRSAVGEIIIHYAYDRQMLSQECLDNIQAAVMAFGFLVQRNENLSFTDFANRIAQHYDTHTDLRTAAIVDGLKTYEADTLAANCHAKLTRLSTLRP